MRWGLGIALALIGGWSLTATAAGAQSKSRNPNAMFDYAQANAFQRYYEAAVAAYDAVIDMQPMNDEAYSNRCWLRAVIGQHLEQALDDCNRVLRLNPNNVQVFDHLGLTYLRMGRYDRSIASYDRLLQFRPRAAESLYGRGLAKKKSGDLKGGELDIAAATAIDPRIAAVFANYGVQ